MAIQYTDTEFSENMPFDEAMEKFTECLKNGTPAQALHVGTVAELNERKANADLKGRLEKLEQEVKEQQSVSTLKSDTIILPNREELKAFGK